MNRNQLTPFGIFDRGLDDVFEGFFRPVPAGQRGRGEMAPALDVTDHDDRYLVHVELPGFRKEDINVSFEDGRLTIEAETRSESERGKDESGKEGRPLIRERRYGRYVRTLQVGPGVDESAINARYEDGVLELELPKSRPETPESRRIEIQ